MSNNKDLIKWYEELGIDTQYTNKPIDQTAAVISQKELALTESSSTIADQCDTIDKLQSAVKAFEGCEIKQGAINTVFGDGNREAKILFIGEAPGATEDIQGIPFCGQSGKLLNNILPSIDLKREDVYITNTVFWRPPGNRRPTSKEIKACRPFVEKLISLISPRLIVLVGNTAVESLLDKKVPMHSLRGKYFKYQNKYMSTPIDIAVIFHPSYLLRQQSKKKEMYIDILRIKAEFL